MVVVSGFPKKLEIRDLNNIVSIIIPYGVTTIRDGMFYQYYNLTSIVIPTVLPL